MLRRATAGRLLPPDHRPLPLLLPGRRGPQQQLQHLAVRARPGERPLDQPRRPAGPARDDGPARPAAAARAQPARPARGARVLRPALRRARRPMAATTTAAPTTGSCKSSSSTRTSRSTSCRSTCELYGDNWDGPLYDWPDYGVCEDDPEAIEHIRKCYAALLTMTDHWLGKLWDEAGRARPLARHAGRPDDRPRDDAGRARVLDEERDAGLQRDRPHPADRPPARLAAGRGARRRR